MKDDSKRKITFGNTDVGITSERVKKMLNNPELAEKLVEAIRKQRKINDPFI